MHTEKQIEQYLKQEIEALNGMCLKFTSPGFTGVPDRIIILPGGKVYFVELKKETGFLSARQIEVRRQFKLLDVTVYALYSYNDINDFLNIILF